MTRRGGFFAPGVKRGILLRDGGLCMMLGAAGCDGKPGEVANHRLNRGMGGARWLNSPSNGCAVSNGCNVRLESDAVFAAEGRRRGVKLVDGDNPEVVPIWSVFFHQWLLLAVDGARLTGVQDPHLSARDASEWLVFELMEVRNVGR